MLAKRPRDDIDPDFDWLSQKKKSRKNPKFGDGFFQVADYLKQPELNGNYYNWEIAQILEHEPVQQIPTKDLKHNLKLEEWDDADGKMFSAQQYLTNPENPKFRHHQKRIKNADLQYPLFLWKDGDTNRFFLIDGMHRYMKVLSSKQKTIDAKILTDDHLRLLKSPLRFMMFVTQEEIELDKYLNTVVRKRIHHFPKTKE